MTGTTLAALRVLGVVGAFMLAETWRSRANERRLLARGAVEPPDDVYAIMAPAYPGCFAVMTAEAIVRHAASPTVAAGMAVFVAAKALKYWAIASLGERWTFRVLVPPDAPLIRTGPYRWLRHPNYLAVAGEIAGVALVLGTPVSGVLCVIGFGWLMRRRVAIEERMLDA